MVHIYYNLFFGKAVRVEEQPGAFASHSLKDSLCPLSGYLGKVGKKKSQWMNN